MMKWLRKHLFSWISQFILIIVISFFGILVLTIVLGGMPHMQMAIRSVEFWFAMRLSMMTSTVSTLICLMLALPTAYALTSRNNPFSKLANILIELPISLPYLVIGLSLLMMFSSDFGKWLKQIGFRVVFDVKGIVFAHVAVNLPFVKIGRAHV